MPQGAAGAPIPSEERDDGRIWVRGKIRHTSRTHPKTRANHTMAASDRFIPCTRVFLSQNTSEDRSAHQRVVSGAALF